MLIDIPCPKPPNSQWHVESPHPLHPPSYRVSETSLYFVVCGTVRLQNGCWRRRILYGPSFDVAYVDMQPGMSLAFGQTRAFLGYPVRNHRGAFGLLAKLRPELPMLTVVRHQSHLEIAVAMRNEEVGIHLETLVEPTLTDGMLYTYLGVGPYTEEEGACDWELTN